MVRCRSSQVEQKNPETTAIRVNRKFFFKEQLGLREDPDKT